MPRAPNGSSTAGKAPRQVQRKARELVGILRCLEGHLAESSRADAVGAAYRGLLDWTRVHQWDDDLEVVLGHLQPEGMYPPWRRQALEEAYMMYYEDCARNGDARVLEQLPEPPTSKERGGRAVPEGMLKERVRQGEAFQGSYDASGLCCARRWEYQIARSSTSTKRAPGLPPVSDGHGRAPGREIVPKGNTSRYCGVQPGHVAAPAAGLSQLLSQADFCCGRGSHRSGFKVSQAALREDRNQPQAPPPWLAARGRASRDDPSEAPSL